MLYDGFGRKVNYLRISVTERCNFRCLYCMPEKPFSWKPKENLLSFEELFLFAKVAIDEGVDKIRITGGEPLLRHDLDKFIAMINNHKKGLDLALTTNGFLLKKVARKLADAGLKRLNISLDSLKKERVFSISQKDVLSDVLKGIDEAKKEGLKIKLNCVPLKNINDDEIVEILQYAKENGFMIRFIEYMENNHANKSIVGLKSVEIQNIISKQYNFKSLGREGSSPAEIYELNDGYRFGIIDPHKHDFCETCNRIRLNAEGLLIPCLYFDEAMSIKDAVKKGDIKAASEILRTVLKNKPEKNRWGEENNEASSRAFYETGG